MNNPIQKSILPALIASTVALSGCGSSSDSTDAQNDSNSTLTSGIITGFGSIYVNGVKFDTDKSQFDIDDNSSASQDDLRIGMRVKIKGSVNDDGVTGTADDVIYENDLKGPVSDIDRSNPLNVLLTVLGQQVVVNVDTTFDDDFGLNIDTISIGDFIEVSGFSSTDSIVATHIEKQTLQAFDFSNDLVEIKGEISDHNEDLGSFNIRGLAIEYDSTTVLDDIPGNTLTEGLYVEVKGTLNDTSDLLTATKIETENDRFDNDADEVEIEGIITEYDVDSMTFKIQGQLIDASNSPLLVPSTLQLLDGIKVEVEGALIDGTLVANKIKLRGQKIKIHAEISSIDSDNGAVSFDLFGGHIITVRINQQTDMEDKLDDLELFTFDQLSPGNFLEVEAFFDGSNVINAVKLERDESDKFRLQGPVDSFDAEVESVMMFDQNFDLSQSIYQDMNGFVINRDDFYSQLATGTFIKLTDKEPVDGVIDEAEIEGPDD